MDISMLLGYNFNAKMFMGGPSGVSNVILTDNPEFTQEDFSKVFPQFSIASEDGSQEGTVPYDAFFLFMLMANKSIKYDRFKNLWKYLMCLYIAHFIVLYMKAVGDPENQETAAILKNALPSGVATSKSVDGLSISYDLLGVQDDLAGYGTWKYTIYGQQLVTLARLYGKPGMYAV